MALRLWRIEEIEHALEKQGCVKQSGWNDRIAGRWWSLASGRWFLVPYPEEPDEDGNASNPLLCRYPDYIVTDLFEAHGLTPP